MRYLTFFGVMLAAATCWAEAGVDVQAPGVHVQTNADRDADPANRPRAHAGEKRIVRASELIGLNVQNSQDETVGEINDLVIDTNTGNLRYVALSAGGVLGVGDNLFAVPWTAFECRRDGDEHVVVLNVDKETLQNAKGFNQDNWPNFADEQWQIENDRFYAPRSTDRRAVTRPILQQ
jgi:sporulation protein YlmC with PRC-barrel domain